MRERSGLTQEELAHRAECHPTWLSQIERGVVNVGWMTLKRVADALGVTMVEIAATAERIELE